MCFGAWATRGRVWAIRGRAWATTSWVSFSFPNFAAFMASQSCVSSAPKSTQATRQQEYYPLWKYVTKVKQMVSGGTWEWKCNLCKNEKTFKGSYTIVNAHILREEIKGIDVCAHMKTT